MLSVPSRRLTAVMSGMKPATTSWTLLARCFGSEARSLSGPLQILYGSQSGNAMGFSLQLEEALQQAGIDCKVTDLYEWKPEATPELKDAVFIMSCYGSGEPTDSARKFYKWLMDGQRAKGSLANLQFSVFGLGSSKTHAQYYNVVGKNVDARLDELGASRMMDRGEGDDSGSLDHDFEEWQGKLLDTLKKLQSAQKPAAAATVTSTTAGASTAAAASAAPASGAACSPAAKPAETVSRKARFIPTCDGEPKDLLKGRPPIAGTVLCKVVANRVLTPGAERPAHEITLEPVNGKLPYETSDHIGIYPANGNEAVAKLCSSLNWDPTVPVEAVDQSAFRARFPSPITTHAMLKYCVDINTPASPAMLKALAAASPSDNVSKQLLQLAGKDAFANVVKYNCLRLQDLLDEYPCRTLPVDAFLRFMPAMQPRYYSISGARSVHGDQLQLSYRRIKYRNPNRELRYGTCTSWMAHLKPSEEALVPAFVRQSTFRLTDKFKPMIWVAGGIGIAPFRAFLEEMSTRPADSRPPIVLFYGVRHSEELMYAQEFEQAVQAGVLTKVYYAFSDPCDTSRWGDSALDRAVISDAIIGAGAHVWDLLQHDGVVYLCGGATGFGEACSRAFRSVAARRGRMSLAESDDYFNSLLADRRYLEDLADA